MGGFDGPHVARRRTASAEARFPIALGSGAKGRGVEDLGATFCLAASRSTFCGPATPARPADPPLSRPL